MEGESEQKRVMGRERVRGRQAARQTQRHKSDMENRERQQGEHLSRASAKT